MMNFTPKRLVLAAGLTLCVMGANAQQLREGYINAGSNTASETFNTLLKNWTPGSQISEDDNFYISRIKPRARFRNTATQVRQTIDSSNDKKLVAWVPVGETDYNALPNGVFDSEVFSMWSYVTHWGDWTAPLGRIPAAFLDVAHKNGVAVSGVASIPYGGISDTYSSMLTGLASVGADKAAQFFHYYGIDGMGYNSEFSCSSTIITNLQKFHENLVKKMRETDPLFENMWYDGTSTYGQISFDKGLASHNKANFASNTGAERSSLFFNYNWNSESLLSSSVTTAKGMKADPLNLYAGINMQGGQPSNLPWSMLAKYPISIGLWGAHSNNMFWESRGELGSDPAVKQSTYLERIERYFTGGTRNPAACPEVRSGHQYNAHNYDWHGISSFMTARSSLSWDLTEEPFITHFNLGNGKFFNYDGVRQHSKSWYNVGVQDYLPTWRWWFASKLLGNTSADVPASGLDANFTWDDAYFGGSTIRISGNTSDEYLHLFKTEYALKKGDVITVKYRLDGGKSDMDLVLSAKGSESTGVSYGLLESTQNADNEEWITKTFTVGSDFDGKDLALVALHFKNATGLSLLLGEFSITRGSYATPAAPTITKAVLLHNCKDGKDGKVIFDMANDKAVGEPCYNIDVNTSFFKLYAQEEGQEPVLMGTTTSWAGMYFSIPSTENVNAKVRLGVSAVSLDQKSESAITWSDYLDAPNYVYSDDIEIDKTTIKPGESFTLGYVDGKHTAGTWKLTDESGKEVFTGSGNQVTVEEGLPAVGNYTLEITGDVHDATTGVATSQTRTYPAYVQVSSESIGAIPQIYTLTANGADQDITVSTGEKVALAYTGRAADGVSSQGVNLQEKHFGVMAGDLGVEDAKSFSVAFWLKINKLASGETQLFSLADKTNAWPKTDWGWIWSNIDETGHISSFTFRGTDATSNNELRYKFANTQLPVGTWAHIAYVFDYKSDGTFHCDFYLNGQKQEVTAWNRTNSSTDKAGDPGYQSNVYKITDGMMIGVAGDAFGRSGIDGAIDNFQVWDKVMTADDVKTSMGELDPNNLPDGLAAFWNLETAPGSEQCFTSVGTKANKKAGIFSYVSGGNEGQGSLQWENPTLTSGSPFVGGNAYQVVTTPSWRGSKADIQNVKGNGQAGSAEATYYQSGDRTVTLTLSNSLGSAEKTFSVIHIAASTGIDEAKGGELKAYTVGENAIVEFAEDGDYEVTVYNLGGQTEAAHAARVTAGGNMQVHLGKTGVYVLSVKKDGKTVRTVKLIRK